MKISYDPEVDALYIRLIEGNHECRTVRLNEEVALNIGAGARNSIGIMLVSGTIIVTAFTLFAVPAIYMLVVRDRQPVESVEMKPAFALAQSPNGHDQIHPQKEGVRVSVA